MPQTKHEIQELLAKAGSQPRETLIRDVRHGMCITDLLGVHTANTVSGDFSLGVEGFVRELRPHQITQIPIHTIERAWLVRSSRSVKEVGGEHLLRAVLRKFRIRLSGSVIRDAGKHIPTDAIPSGKAKVRGCGKSAILAAPASIEHSDDCHLVQIIFIIGWLAHVSIGRRKDQPASCPILARGKTGVVTVSQEDFTADYFLIATGSRPYRPDDIDFTHPLILDSDKLLTLKFTPKTAVIYGAGVIGCEYASMLDNMGMDVTLINTRSRLLAFLDDEITDALSFYMSENGVRIRFMT